MHNKKISVIVPVYNVEKYLNRCVDSILGQTHDNLEIILVDDGSPDGCPAICDAYAAKDSRVKVIHKENGGLSDARNAGIHVSTGRYLMFVDSDDYIAADMCECLYNALVENDADISMCNICYVDEETYCIKDYSDLKAAVLDRTDFLDQIERGVGCVAWGKLYKHEIFDNIRYPKGRIHEDEAVIHEIAYAVQKISVVQAPMYFYVQRKESITNGGYSVKKLDAVRALLERAEFFCSRSEKLGRTRYCLVTAIKCMYRILDHLPYSRTTRDAYKEIFVSYRNTWKKVKHLPFCFRDRIVFMSHCYFTRPLHFWKRIVDSVKNIYEAFLDGTLKSVLQSIFFQKRLFLFYTPVHTNMGDQAIRSGEMRFLNTFFPQYKIIELTEKIWREDTEKIFKKLIKNTDLLMIHGGGYLGDLWLNGENSFKHIVETFPQNKIIAFSQTAYFSDTAIGQALLSDDRDFYRTHTNVSFFLRDWSSYTSMTALTDEKRCFYYPDMALMLDPKMNMERSGVLLCTRGDHEKVLGAELFEKLKQMLLENEIPVQYIDTVISQPKNFRVLQSVRDKYLRRKIEEFASAELVITERLHGMILAAITGTPCIALDNISKKVSGVYAWIKHLDYVRVMQYEDITMETVREMLAMQDRTFDNTELMQQFQNMASTIKDSMKE